MTDVNKVLPGEPLRIPAATYNAFIDAARAAPPATNRGARPFSGRQLVTVQNSSGADVDRFGVLGIDGVIFSRTDNEIEFENNWSFDCSEPATASHVGKFVIVAEPIANGAIGKAFISGTCPVQINMNAATNEFADISDGDATMLESASSGAARILYVADTSSVQWGIVLLSGGGGGGDIRLGKPTEP